MCYIEHHTLTFISILICWPIKIIFLNVSCTIMMYCDVFVVLTSKLADHSYAKNLLNSPYIFPMHIAKR